MPAPTAGPRQRPGADGSVGAWQDGAERIHTVVAVDVGDVEPHPGTQRQVGGGPAQREGPEEVFAMESEVVAVEGDTGVARLVVRYGDPVRQTYRDLWVVRFDAQGRCLAFEEWPFWPPGARGGWIEGPRAVAPSP
jgi:hypothetical protein